MTDLKRFDFFDMEVADRIRRAHGEGAGEVEIDGRLFRVELRSYERAFWLAVPWIVNPVQTVRHRTFEEWLLVKPADGELVPCGQIELHGQGCCRTAFERWAGK